MCLNMILSEASFKNDFKTLYATVSWNWVTLSKYERNNIIRRVKSEQIQEDLAYSSGRGGQTLYSH